MPNVSAPIVVCIDGSDAAITAAEWAAKEAASRDVALRLVHVAPPTDPANPELRPGVWCTGVRPGGRVVAR
ncbi:universal stress protein [Mycobacterium sp. DSM 3803]|nr:universal stress protein [Mycobacterium sp. DSM 3803]